MRRVQLYVHVTVAVPILEDAAGKHRDQVEIIFADATEHEEPRARIALLVASGCIEGGGGKLMGTALARVGAEEQHVDAQSPRESMDTQVVVMFVAMVMGSSLRISCTISTTSRSSCLCVREEYTQGPVSSRNFWLLPT